MSGKDIGRKRITIYPAQRMNHKILLHFFFFLFFSSLFTGWETWQQSFEYLVVRMGNHHAQASNSQFIIAVADMVIRVV